VRVGLLASSIHHMVAVGSEEEARARQLTALGFAGVDALYLACAESAGVNAFLTTGDRLLKLASRHAGQLRIRVENPLTWLQDRGE